jgi:hypothetical protein
MSDAHLEQVHSELCVAMVAGDLAELGTILADGSSLTHTRAFFAAAA